MSEVLTFAAGSYRYLKGVFRVYAMHDFHPLLGPEIVRRGTAPGGITWHYARPPVIDLGFELDVRGVSRANS